MRWPRNLKKKLLISATTLVVLFVVGELVARAIEPGPFSLWDKNPYVHYEDDRAYRHKADFAGRWDGTWYATNSLGMRGGDLALTFGINELRVACVGDSCTFGKGVAEAHTWPRQLERLMQDEVGADRRVVVANLGVSGYSGVTYRRIFTDLADQVRPNLVVIGYNLNDFPNAIQAVDEKVFRDRGLRNMLSQGMRDKLGRLALYRLARQTYYHVKRKSDWAKAEAVASKAADLDLESEVWKKQESYLLGIRDLARDEYGARTAVFLFPYESQVFLDGYDTTPIDRLKALGAKHDIPVIDLAEVFRSYAREEDPPRELFLRGDRYHPNPQGYHLVAQRVLDELNEQGWLSE